MSEQKRRKNNSSRTVVIAVVVVLIVVAIAGIVLASRGTPPPPGEVAQAPTAAPASTPVAAAAPTEPINPNEVVFAAGSDKLPASAAVSLGRFAEAAHNAAGVRMSARFLTGANKARDLELAKGRTEAIRKVLQADGVGAEKMQVELVEMPAGSLTEAAADRVDLTLR
jgi:outer membrane protein OmpA-like peptidoglycan-associated protein